MKGIYFDGKTATYREDLSIPEMVPGKSLIKIKRAAVCSTDKEILKGYRPDFKGIMGHEFMGIVEKSEDATLIGKRVVGEINEVCGQCIYCKTNRPHHCQNRTTPGLSRDGCFAEYMVLKNENIHVIPDTLSDDVAVFTEPLAAAFEILEQVDIKSGTPVAIIGDGRLALCIANVLKLTGADITVIGKHEDKLAIFSEFAKTSTVYEKEGYEIVVDATGSPSGIQNALEAVRKMGTIVLKSTYADNATLNLSLIPVNEITIVGSRCGPFLPAIEALDRGRIVLPKIEIYDLSDFEAAFSSKAFKAGFEF